MPVGKLLSCACTDCNKCALLIEFDTQRQYSNEMRCFGIIFAIVTCAWLVIGGDLYAVRYAQCDACGLCRHTVMSKNCLDNPDRGINGDTTSPSCRSSGASTGPGDVVYIQPDSWSECILCLYPNQPPTNCDEFDAVPVNRDVAFYSATEDGFALINSTSSKKRCDTLIIDSITNRPENEPQEGRVYSDLGCFETSENFTSPNASTDVVKKLLGIVQTATGGVGLILVMRAALRLATSRGDAEKIHEAKKSLTNVVIGVLFVLFSVFIFSFFAAQVLRIPGYTVSTAPTPTPTPIP